MIETPVLLRNDAIETLQQSSPEESALHTDNLIIAAKGMRGLAVRGFVILPTILVQKITERIFLTSLEADRNHETAILMALHGDACFFPLGEITAQIGLFCA